MSGLENAIGAVRQIIQGVSLVGDAMNMLIRCFFLLFGIDVPDTIIRIATLIFIILIVWKVGESMNKILLLILVFLAISQLTGFLTPLLSMVGWKVSGIVVQPPVLTCVSEGSML